MEPTPEDQPLTLSYAEAQERQKTEPYTGQYLVELPDHAREFVANGRRYVVRETVAAWRFLLLEQFNTEFTLTGGIATIFSDLVEQRAALDKIKFSDVAVINNRLLNGIAKLDEKLNYAFQVCTLFISTDGEDLRKWDQPLADQKIEDWNEAGLDAGFFLRFAVRSVPGFIAAYKSVSLLNLPQETTS